MSPQNGSVFGRERFSWTNDNAALFMEEHTMKHSAMWMLPLGGQLHLQASSLGWRWQAKLHSGFLDPGYCD